jgi:hypothetical protein
MTTWQTIPVEGLEPNDRYRLGLGCLSTLTLSAPIRQGGRWWALVKDPNEDPRVAVWELGQTVEVRRPLYVVTCTTASDWRSDPLTRAKAEELRDSIEQVNACHGQHTIREYEETDQ